MLQRTRSRWGSRLSGLGAAEPAYSAHPARVEDAIGCWWCGSGGYDRPPRLHDKSQGLRQHPPLPCSYQTRSLDTETGGSPEQRWRRIKFLVCRSIITDRTLLGSVEGASKTQTLARSQKKKENFLCVASLAALDLLAIKEWADEEKSVLANIIFPSRVRVEKFKITAFCQVCTVQRKECHENDHRENYCYSFFREAVMRDYARLRTIQFKRKQPDVNTETYFTE